MRSKLYLYTFVAAIGGLLFGYDTAVISGTIPYIREYFQMSDASLGWAVSSALLGCIIGALRVGKPADVWGRKRVLKFIALLFLVSAIWTGLSFSLSVFIIARFIGGLAVGGASVVSPMYISEIAPPEKRGRLVATAQLAIVVGILTAFFSNYWLVDTGEDNWRYMFMSEGVPAFAFLSLLFFVGESPRWLVRVGCPDEAKQTVKSINPGADVERTIREIGLSLNNDVLGHSVMLFKKPYLRLVLIGIAVGMFNQFTGINVIMYYAPAIFKAAGFSDNSSLMQTVLVGLTNLVFTILAMSVIDKFGRKFLLMLGSIGMTFFLTLFSILYLNQFFSGYWLLSAMLAFIAFFASSQGVVIWVILSEMFPNNIRARASSMGSFSLWFFNALTSFLFPIVSGKFGVGPVFGFYAVATLLSVFFIKRFLVETKNVPLEELEKLVLKE